MRHGAPSVNDFFSQDDLWRGPSHVELIKTKDLAHKKIAIINTLDASRMLCQDPDPLEDGREALE